jgi:hypothetical protein
VTAVNDQNQFPCHMLLLLYIDAIYYTQICSAGQLTNPVAD